MNRSKTTAERIVATATRAEYWDELERRDPEGFAAWLGAGPRPDSDHGRYVTKEPARPSERIKARFHRLMSDQTQGGIRGDDDR